MLGCAAAVLGPPPVSSSARSSGVSSSSWSSFFPGVVLGLVLGATPIAPLLVFTTDAHRGQRWRGLVAEEVHMSDLLASASELWTVQHRVELERADIDHVATAAAGVLAIETKWMSTWDPSWAERHLAQTRWGAGKIRSVMRSTVVGQPDVPVHAVLVVWGGALAQLGSDVREVDGVVVIPGSAGPEAFARFGNGTLRRADAEQVGERLRVFVAARDEHRRQVARAARRTARNDAAVVVPSPARPSRPDPTPVALRTSGLARAGGRPADR